MSYEIGCKLDNQGNFIPHNHVMQEIILEEMQAGEYYVLEVKKMTDKKKRTLPQNNAIHKFISDLSKAFNERGFDVKCVMTALAAKLFVIWTPKLVKELIWHKIQKAMLGKESTADLEKKEVSMIYDTINRFTTTELDGLHVPFPSMDGLMFEQELKEKQR